MTVPSASPYLFGILTSEMHMAWVRQVCGRLKSDFRYSNSLVYNNYPFPPAPTEAQRQAVTDAAEAVLAARAAFPSELARLEFLFGLYQQLSAPLLGAAPKVKSSLALSKALRSRAATVLPAAPPSSYSLLPTRADQLARSCLFTPCTS